MSVGRSKGEGERQEKESEKEKKKITCQRSGVKFKSEAKLPNIQKTHNAYLMTQKTPSHTDASLRC